MEAMWNYPLPEILYRRNVDDVEARRRRKTIEVMQLSSIVIMMTW